MQRICVKIAARILIQQFYCRPHNDSMVTVEHFSLILYFLENTSCSYSISLFARTTCALILHNCAINCNIISLRRNLDPNSGSDGEKFFDIGKRSARLIVPKLKEGHRMLRMERVGSGKETLYIPTEVAANSTTKTR
jgi:hypothetical protein